jgi:DNA helicase HerA-like ATPase
LSKLLRISEDLGLPLDVVTQKLAFLGRTGSGKTYGSSKLAELMLDAGAQVVILDVVGVWYGLRLDADGKANGIEIPVFGGLHGDVPLEPTGGHLMADLIVDRGLSVVLDLSQFESDAAKARFAGEWADRFFFRKKAAPGAVHIFLEECQEFVPQNPQRGEERMLHAFQRIEKLGRNFGIGVSLISQRPQEVNKKALNQTAVTVDVPAGLL